MASWDLSKDQSFKVYTKFEDVHVKCGITREYYETKRTSVEMLSVGQKKLEQIE